MTQLEDPRLEWLSIQEAMLREYLSTAQEALEVSFRIISNNKGIDLMTLIFWFNIDVEKALKWESPDLGSLNNW